jgi:hypothetical protein
MAGGGGRGSISREKRTFSTQALFDDLGKGDSYGASTTHWDKLIPKVEGGAAGGCPLLLVGMGVSLSDSSHFDLLGPSDGLSKIFWIVFDPFEESSRGTKTLLIVIVYNHGL